MKYVGAGLMIREPKGTYLFVRRSQAPQHWEMPGGHRDKGETDPYLTAIRETKEELGRVPLHKIDFADNHPSGRKLPFWAFFVDVKRKFSPKLSGEHVDYRWMTIDEALSDPLPMHPKLKATLLAHQLPNGRLASDKFTRLKPNTMVTVYHGTSMMSVADLINGFDANEVVPRDYGGPRHAGLFVAPDIETAERFAHYGQVILEIKTQAKNLHGTDFSGRTGKEQRLQSDLSWIDEKYPDSFRPYLTYTLNQANEPQALLRGLVKPNQIKRVRYKPYGQEPMWLTRKQFLNLGLSSERRSSGRTGRFIKDIRQAGCDLSTTRLTAQEILECIAVTLDTPMDRVEKAVTRSIRFGGLDQLLRQVGFGETAIKSHVKKLDKFYKVPAGKMSARPIRLPTRKIKALAKDLARKLKARGLPKPNRVVAEELLTLPNVKGDDVNVEIVLAGSPRFDFDKNDLIHGAYFKQSQPAKGIPAWASPLPSKLVVYVNSSIPPESFEKRPNRIVEEELYSILTHELTHAADIWSGKGSGVGADVLGKDDFRRRHHNHPMEVKALMRDVATTVEPDVRFYLEAGMPFNTAVTHALKDSKWVEIEPYLTPQNKKTILKGVYTHLQDQPIPAGKMSASFTVPENVRKAAQKGLDLRAKQPAGRKAGLTPQEAGKLGIGSGVARARDLISGRVSYDTVKRMKAYFSRHAKNYKLDPGKRPVDDKGYVAGLLWGGEPGRVWANKIVRQNQ
jgi:8-oxo-dGTP pyrophosphatase MutT (NUDIX family)